MLKKKFFAIIIATLTLAVSGCGGNNKVSADEAANAQAGSEALMTYEKEGAEYIATQLKADSTLKKTASGLVYKIIEPGSGANFTTSDKIDVIYTGMHINGEQFDSSNGTPVTFSPEQVVPGFKEMLLLMKPGAKARCIIPGNLAYGEQGNQGIGPNETLIFELETVGVQE